MQITEQVSIIVDHGNSFESGAQYLWTHFPDDDFEISSPTLIGALHSEHVVLNFAFMTLQDNVHR